MAVRARAIQSFRLRLHSGLRQSGSVLRVGGVFLGLRPRLVYVAPLALGGFLLAEADEAEADEAEAGLGGGFG